MMAAARPFLRTSQMIATGARYFAASRGMWDTPTAAWRYFWSAHRPLADHEQSFRIRVRDFSLTIRPKDWCAFEEVLVRDEYRCVDEILKNSQRPRVLDLGANIGLFGVRVFMCCAQAQVIAVEPSLSTFRVLQENCAANPAYAWQPLRYAVWSCDGSVGFENTAYSTGSRVSNAGRETVPAISFERLLAAHAGTAFDLAKIDIEGAELEVLTSGEKMLDRIGCLVLEIHPRVCSVDRVLAIVARHFDYLYDVPARVSVKPLIVASRRRLALPRLAGWQP